MYGLISDTYSGAQIKYISGTGNGTFNPRTINYHGATYYVMDTGISSASGGLGVTFDVPSLGVFSDNTGVQALDKYYGN